ncbi:MAG TPA: Re/Si-specific NAD(P)(+) transhydrogenase subunit alpha [Verrucomicrobiota bacterium]|nr:Re/Si-specific NAD(P)(+) transhydrogenase subunit alpha [Verrucomicrobiota bacterium]
MAIWRSLASNQTVLIGIPKETVARECRVAAAPENVTKFIKLGFDVAVEAGAGDAANFSDALYEQAGASVISAVDLWAKTDILLKMRPPQVDEVELIRKGATLISFMQPAQNNELLERLAKRRINAVAMDAVPRISRAQSMDALSSMANIAGYRAMVEASGEFGRFFTGQITAAGRVPPAKVLVIGAGVAGLSAIGTAVKLGAIVRAFDTRPAVKDEVRSMGAEFLELEFEEDGTGEGGYAKVMSKEFIEAEMKLFAEQAAEVDIIVTTAMIPGKKSPVLITEEMVRSMKEGSVIVDLAAEGGGNCELTRPNEKVVEHGVILLGYTDLPSRLATQSSTLYGNNLVKLLGLLGCSGKFELDFDDEIVRGATVVRDGEITWPPPQSANPPSPPKSKPAAVQPDTEKVTVKSSLPAVLLGFACLALLALGWNGSSEFLDQLTVFTLSCFVGYMVVWNVTPALHTPLMSVTNAISGIIVLGGMLFISSDNPAVLALSGLAVLIATVNVAGGFLVTRRMLKMFHR